MGFFSDTIDAVTDAVSSAVTSAEQNFELGLAGLSDLVSGEKTAADLYGQQAGDGNPITTAQLQAAARKVETPKALLTAAQKTEYQVANVATAGVGGVAAGITKRLLDEVRDAATPDPSGFPWVKVLLGVTAACGLLVAAGYAIKAIKS